MNKKTLTSLFAESLYRIPDYQRGYAWEKKQLRDFTQDIDALVDEEVTSHYTGTVVVYAKRDGEPQDYGRKRLKIVDVVDGQQRLTTSCLYLSVVIQALLNKGEQDHESDIPDFLYSGATCKLSLSNETEDIFYDLLKNGRANIPARSPHGKRLIEAYAHFQEHIDMQLGKLGANGVDYLKKIYHAISQKLHFTFYTIEEECEIGMTFELMNSRGKGLSVLELLKNYLMHWISRNEKDAKERSELTDLINKYWKYTYTNLGLCAGNEDQCLRIAWTLYCSHSPQNWKGYDGFKGDDYIPLRNFSTMRTEKDTKDFIVRFAEGLADISTHYVSIISPTENNTNSSDELLWLTKIHHTGNIANFLPLMVAARTNRLDENISEEDYISLLKALECYAYRVFLYEGRKSNAGKSSFYKWGDAIFTQSQTLKEVTALVYGLARYYAPEDSFTSDNAKCDDWYSGHRTLRYTLFEYELHLLTTEGQGKEPHLTWKQLSDSTIEHILPQTPEENSDWKKNWNQEDFNKCLHDIGNLVLTQDNSSYRNFEFARKKGVTGKSPSYSNSDIRQERKISAFSDWTIKEFTERRNEVVEWINDRWKTEGSPSTKIMDKPDEEDEDSV